MAPRDANWIDGLRGVASFMVVTGHLCTAFIPWVHSPASSPEASPHLFQRPFFRLIVGGRAAVALFLLITGYVNSIGPISRAKSGNVDAAFSGIARSAFARSGRLVLPTFIATTLTWFLANIGAYDMIKHCDATWIRQGWHQREPTLWAALVSLVKALMGTWTTGWNEYDGTQWTLHLFLSGAMYVYIVMVATVKTTMRARMLVYAVLWAYSWQLGQGLAHDALKGLNIVFGMFVAELHNHYKDGATNVLPTPVPALMIFFGMFIAGYPQDNPHNAAWSSHMCNFMHTITVKDADVRRFWDHFGAGLVILGIFFSRNARRVLTSPIFNFLGRCSFPVYLMHNTFIKSVLGWLVYLPSALHPEFNEKGEKMDLKRGSTTHILIAVVIYFYVVYRAAMLWVAYIDPMCGRIVDRFVRWAYGEEAPPANANGANGTLRGQHVLKEGLPK